MSKKKIVIFTCFLALLGCALYFFKGQSTSPLKPKASIDATEDRDKKATKKPLKRAGSLTFSPHYPDSDKRGALSEKELRSQLKNLIKFCEEEYPQYKDLFPDIETLTSVLKKEDLKQMWLNIHLKDQDNRVWRVRKFLDDGPNGDVQRVILYKEDETGFPRIIQTSENDKKVSPNQLFEKFLSKGDPVFTDEAYSLIHEGSDFFFELTNGQITRIDISTAESHIDCQVPH